MFLPRFDRRSASLATDLAFAPAVVFMRLPLLAAEARENLFSGVETALAVREKAEAVAEGLVATQLALFGSALRFWPDIFAGANPASMLDRAVNQATHAALKPVGRRVRANYRRLSRS